MKKIMFAALLMLAGHPKVYGFTLVEVFTTHGEAIKTLSEQIHRKRAYRLVIHNLNRVEAWEKSFSEGLPGDEAAARAEVDRRIKTMGGQAVFGHEVLNAYEPLMRATKIGLKEFPAVVIDESYVVYGTDDIDLAIQRVRAWKKSRAQ